MPKYSVVVPLYNKEKYIKDTLESVLMQNYDDYEVVVVNDGSSDSSYKVVEQMCHEYPQIKLISQRNAGVAVARNTGIAAATGEYIAFLDADDEWKSNYLEEIDWLVQNYPQSSIFVTAYDIRLSSSVIHHSTQLTQKQGLLDSYWKTYANHYDFVWTSATVLRKSACLKAGMFTSGEKIGQDLDMWARVACNNPVVAYTAKSCVIYNRSAEQNARTRVKIAYPKEFMKVLRAEMVSERWTNKEKACMQSKYNKKMVVYIFTSIMAGKQREARLLLRQWKKENPNKYIFPLQVASYLPNKVNEWVYAMRLRIF